MWVSSGYTAYRDVNKWVDTSHWGKQTYSVWVNSGYREYYWVNTSHNVWVSSGYTTYYWVNTSHNVWVSSGYWASRWVNTSHWETRWYYNRGWKSYNVWVSSGYTTYYWVNTSHNVWVSSGYWASRWVNTSHWAWVISGYLANKWVDTSHWETTYRDVWVSSGYNKTVKEAYWVDTSHWEDQKVWVGGHYETRYIYMEDWQPCDVTFIDQLLPSEPKNVLAAMWNRADNNPYEKTISGTTYLCNISYYSVLTGNNLFSFVPHPWVIFKIKYDCYKVLNWKKEAYSVWVGGNWKREWVDTSHRVSSGYWQSYTYRTWVDTSHWVSSGYLEYYWVDTSHNVWVSSGYWEDYTKRTWVDTSHFETRDFWVDTSHYVEAELDSEGKVMHTDKWNENRINYNLSKTGLPEKPRGYEIFFNGERFVLECDTLGDFQPESVHVEFLGTKFETDLTKTGDSKWEGYIWDEIFLNFGDRECVFKFTATYAGGIEIEDEVTVWIDEESYWILHRGF
ncbi:MAG: hypothetical protein ACYDIA_03700 [Candidatus Humimicrobiaceae bacterium]